MLISVDVHGYNHYVRSYMMEPLASPHKSTSSNTVAIQLMVPFIHLRTIFEVRERRSRMYHWTALVTSQLIVEIPWNILGSSVFYWCVLIDIV
jgi:hypothetical protein